jgi:DNA-binding CsgD family transcriptional regulator
MRRDRKRKAATKIIDPDSISFELKENVNDFKVMKRFSFRELYEDDPEANTVDKILDKLFSLGASIKIIDHSKSFRIKLEYADRKIFIYEKDFEEKSVKHIEGGLPDNEIKKYFGYFTKSERTVLAFVCKGYTSHQIVDAMNISKNTLKTHLKNLYEKAEVHNKTALILMFETFFH